MKKKGFTLIELLAVIVILAIIALIATPAVLNIIEDSRKGAAEASARNIVNAAKTYTMQSTMNGNSVDKVDLSNDTLKYDGDQATKGYVIFDENGKATSKMYVNGYCVEIAADGKVTSEKVEEDECDVTVETTNTSQKLVFPVANGQEVYFNPTTGYACSKNEVVSSKTGTNSGCMKWYAFLDSESSDKLNLILDHNTVATFDWTGSQTVEDVTKALTDAAPNWKQVVNGVETSVVLRTLSGDELYQIAPSKEPDANYVLHNGENNYSDVSAENIYKGPAGTNKYAWLFDNFSGCEEYGCNSSEDNGEAGGYMTDYLEQAGYIIVGDGTAFMTIYAGTSCYGLRPVIEVSKDVFK